MAIQTQSIDYTHDGVALAGHLAWDDSIDGPRPGILVGHAWAGRSPFENQKAEDLARLGYVGFALDLYGKGVLGSGPEENSALMQPLLDDRPLLQDRLKTALAAMVASDVVDERRTAIIGYCFGGLCALDLARTGTDIAGAVSFHGLFAPPGNTAKIKAKVLALHGWGDPMAPPESVLALASEMTEAGADWQLHGYGNTLHSFTNPEANDPGFGTMYSADADRRSWQALENFLGELF